MVEQLYDEARLIADCRNDEVVADAHRIAEVMRLRGEVAGMLRISKFMEIAEAAEQGGADWDRVKMFIEEDDFAFAVVSTDEEDESEYPGISG